MFIQITTSVSDGCKFECICRNKQQTGETHKRIQYVEETQWWCLFENSAFLPVQTQESLLNVWPYLNKYIHSHQGSGDSDVHKGSKFVHFCYWNLLHPLMSLCNFKHFLKNNKHLHYNNLPIWIKPKANGQADQILPIKLERLINQPTTRGRSISWLVLLLQHSHIIHSHNQWVLHGPKNRRAIAFTPAKM